MNYYDEIKNSLLENELYKKAKDYSKNRNDLNTYYKVGKLLAEAGKHYGERIIKEYSKRLTNELNLKYDSSSLNKMKKFYYLVEKMATVSPLLSYSHYVELLSIEDVAKIKYYIEIVETQNLSVRQLRQKIKNSEYERVPQDTKQQLGIETQFYVEALIKNPILIKNSKHCNVLSEKMIKQLILEDIDNFLLELGNDFCYVGNEYKIKIGERYNYIDLLLYNIEFNCYVVVELKVTELKKEHIGQIEIYMNYIDKNLKKINQDKTIGIIICKKDNQFIMEYCSDERILFREYELL